MQIRECELDSNALKGLCKTRWFWCLTRGIEPRISALSSLISRLISAYEKPRTTLENNHRIDSRNRLRIRVQLSGLERVCG